MEYLTQLRRFQKTRKGVKQICIHDHNAKRNKWKLCKVIELLSGNDKIPIEAGIYNIKRLITKVYPLEIPAVIDHKLRPRKPVSYFASLMNIKRRIYH